MTIEFFPPMLDVGSPRVFNCCVLTQRIFEKDPNAVPFFRTKGLNKVILIKDNIPDTDERFKVTAIGTKLYFPFNEQNIYGGGRTIFAHDPRLEDALAEVLGKGALIKENLIEDKRAIALFDRLPSLDPFLLKDIFLDQSLKVNDAYFEVGPEIWNEIEGFILERFEPVASAAFPDAATNDERAHQLIEKIWEARDLQALKPLVDAFRLPENEAIEIFSAWKGINFYLFQREKSKPLLLEMFAWLKEVRLPIIAMASVERDEYKAMIESTRVQLRAEYQKVDGILKDYQTSYDKMFRYKTSTSEFVSFLKTANKLYYDLGYSLGKMGQATYGWDLISKRHPDRRLPWDQLRQMIPMLAQIFKQQQKPATGVSWT